MSQDVVAMSQAGGDRPPATKKLRSRSGSSSSSSSEEDFEDGPSAPIKTTSRTPVEERAQPRSCDDSQQPQPASASSSVIPSGMSASGSSSVGGSSGSGSSGFGSSGSGSSDAGSSGTGPSGCRTCGGHDYQRRSSRRCPFNARHVRASQPRQSAPGSEGGDASAASGGAPASVGTRSSPRAEPNRSAYQNTWGDVRCVDRFELEEAQAFMLRYFGDRDREHVQQIYSSLRDRGHLNRESTVWNIFDYLSRDAITSLLTLIHAAHNKAKQHGRDVDEPEVKEWELYCWLGQTLYWGLGLCSAEAAFKTLHRNMSMRWGPTTMLQITRFNLVNRYVQAFDPNDVGMRGVASLSQHWVDIAMRQSAKTFTTTVSTATLDDEAIGSKAQDVEVHGHSHKKRFQNHQPSDVVVDVATRAIVGVQYRQAGRPQLEMVENLLTFWVKTNAGIDSLHGVITTFDRGYSKRAVWEMFARRGMPFVGICGDSFNGHPMVAESETASCRYLVGSRIPDAGQLGDAVYWTTRTVRHPGASGTSVATVALAVRQNSRRKATTDAQRRNTQVLRFVCGGLPHQEQLPSVMCFVRYVVAPDSRRATLFFPSAHVDPGGWKALLESKLTSRGVVPLTAAQRTADWFIRKRYLITGTNALHLARLSPAVTDLLFATTAQPGNEKSDAEVFHSLCDHWFSRKRASQQMKMGTSNEPFVVQALRDSEEVVELFDIGLVTHTNYQGIGVSADGVALLPSRVYANVSDDPRATDDAAIDISDVGVDSDEDSDTYTATDTSFDDSSGDSDDDDDDDNISGTDDSNISGTDDSNSNNGHEPHSIDDVVAASVEIKTRTTPTTIRKSEDIAQKLGRNITCKVGSRLWFATVPGEYRAQVLHQMLVLQLQHAVFVVARRGAMIYTVFIQWDDDIQRNNFLQSLMKWRHVWQWLHDKTPPPSTLDPADIELALSHRPMWDAVQRYAGEKPMWPVKKFRTGIQCVYSRLKSGLDSATQDVLKTYNFCQKFSLASKIPNQVLRQICFNSVVGYRLWKAWPTARNNWKGVRAFRRSMTRPGIIPDHLQDLAQLLIYNGHLKKLAGNQQLASGTSAAAVVSPVAAARGGGDRVQPPTAIVTRHRVAYLLKEGNQIRVTGSHLAKHAGKRSRCHWCHHIARRRQLCFTKCTLCDIYLCIHEERQCFIDFHTHNPDTEAVERDTQ